MVPCLGSFCVNNTESVHLYFNKIERLLGFAYSQELFTKVGSTYAPKYRTGVSTMHRAVLLRLCPEYTLWAEQQACSTCSAASRIKALCAAGQGLFCVAPANNLHRLHYQSFHFSRHFAGQQLYRTRMILLQVAAFYSWERAGWRETHSEAVLGRNRSLTSVRDRSK